MTEVSRFLEIPPARLEQETLRALLEEFASRDGTDYGLEETPLEDRVAALESQLAGRRIVLVFDRVTETWDLVPADETDSLLSQDETDQHPNV